MKDDINDATLEYRNVMKFISCCFTWIDDNDSRFRNEFNENYVRTKAKQIWFISKVSTVDLIGISSDPYQIFSIPT